MQLVRKAPVLVHKVWYVASRSSSALVLQVRVLQVRGLLLLDLVRRAEVRILPALRAQVFRHVQEWAA